MTAMLIKFSYGKRMNTADKRRKFDLSVQISFALTNANHLQLFNGAPIY